MEKGTGRLFTPDSRDLGHLMQARVDAVAEVPNFRYWPPLRFLDQLKTSTCVAQMWLSLREGSPVRCPVDPGFTAYDLYRMIVLLDEWAENDGEATAADTGLLFGSSVRAGAKAALQLGWIAGGYDWAFDVMTAARHVAVFGPVGMGTNWTYAMSQPTPEGFVSYKGDRTRLGHAYVWDGINFKRGVARFRNSWGRGWGKNGFFYMALEDAERLIAADGEACAPKELPQ